MKSHTITLAFILLFTTYQSEAAHSNHIDYLPDHQIRAAGGPDDFGYTWADSNEVGGPVFNWIDITGIGTEVMGFADDNSVPLIPMGMNFQYYWITFSEIKIGSNGWLSFDDVGNVAHCFPTTPSPGGAADNLIAPFMTDLNFSGNNNPGQVFYYNDAMNEQFIISFIDVPRWINANPDFIGSNTFQIILSAMDNSITFQYLDVDQANFDNTAGCLSDLEIGFENNTGNIGLEILNDQVPADNLAIKITYPGVPLIDIEDPAPIWNQNDENKAVFALADEDFSLITHVRNTGNVDTTSAIDVTMAVFDESNMEVYSSTENLPSLMTQEETDVIFTTPLNDMAGSYRLESTTTSVTDINPANNQSISELNLLNSSVSPVQLNYVIDDSTPGSLSWTGGNGGAAVYYQPPFEGWHIDSVEMFITTGTGVGADYTIGIYANDALDELPGTLLTSIVVPEGSYTFDTWTLSQLPTPVVAPDNGFFISWEQNNNEGMAIGTIEAEPISRQSYELLGGQWANYRDNNSTELMIRVNMIDLIFTNDFE